MSRSCLRALSVFRLQAEMEGRDDVLRRVRYPTWRLPDVEKQKEMLSVLKRYIYEEQQETLKESISLKRAIIQKSNTTKHPFPNATLHKSKVLFVLPRLVNVCNHVTNYPFINQCSQHVGVNRQELNVLYIYIYI